LRLRNEVEVKVEVEVKIEVKDEKTRLIRKIAKNLRTINLTG